MKTDFKSIFFDTAPFIHLIEGHPQFAPVVKNILIFCQSHSGQLTTSVLIGLEFKTKPLRENRTDVARAFDELMTDSHMQVVSIMAGIVEKALSLQTQLISLKAMDSMQLGAAASPV